MRTFRRILTLLLLAVVIPATAQTSLRKALINYQKINMSGFLSGNDMKETFSKINPLLIKDYDEEVSSQLIDKFFDEYFIETAVDAMIEYYEGSVTPEEMNELTEALTSHKGKVFSEHADAINSNTELIESISVNVAEKIREGGTPDNIVETPGIPKKYKELYSQYYSLSNTDMMISQLLQAYSQMIDTDDSNEFFTKYENYMRENLPIIMLNESYKYLTMDDLKFGVDLYSTKAWEHFSEGSKKMSEHLMEVSIALMGGYVDWLKNQDVELNM